MQSRMGTLTEAATLNTLHVTCNTSLSELTAPPRGLPHGASYQVSADRKIAISRRFHRHGTLFQVSLGRTLLANSYQAA